MRRRSGPRRQVLGLPNAELAVCANSAAMVAGGAALTLDKLPRPGCLRAHHRDYPHHPGRSCLWRFDGAERNGHQIQFMKNAALVGGLVLVLTGRL